MKPRSPNSAARAEKRAIRPRYFCWALSNYGALWSTHRTGTEARRAAEEAIGEPWHICAESMEVWRCQVVPCAAVEAASPPAAGGETPETDAVSNSLTGTDIHYWWQRYSDLALRLERSRDHERARSDSLAAELEGARALHASASKNSQMHYENSAVWKSRYESAVAFLDLLEREASTMISRNDLLEAILNKTRDFLRAPLNAAIDQARET